MTADDENGRGGAGPTVRRESVGIGEFLAGVRTALADLPPDELAEILDDARTHLVEMSDEPDAATDIAALTARLGTPERYAADLRAAAGYPPAPQPRRTTGRAWARVAVLALVVSTLALASVVPSGEPTLALVAGLATLLALPVLVRDGPGVASVAALPEVRRALARRPEPSGRGAGAFVASLQPGWWLLRALVAAALAAMVVSGGGASAVLAFVLVAVVAVPLSIGLGRLSRRDRRWLWVVAPLNGLAAALLVAAAVVLPSDPEPESIELPGLVQNGVPITDIRPYDAQGRPLSGVHLFDQDGHPVDAISYTCDDGSAPPVEPRPYPRGAALYDDVTGRCTVVPQPPLVVVLPTAPTAATTPATAPNTSPPATADVSAPPSR